MLKFDEQAQIDNVNGALALRHKINPIVDEICKKGFKIFAGWVSVALMHRACRYTRT